MSEYFSFLSAVTLTHNNVSFWGSLGRRCLYSTGGNVQGIPQFFQRAFGQRTRETWGLVNAHYPTTVTHEQLVSDTRSRTILLVHVKQNFNS